MPCCALQAAFEIDGIDEGSRTGWSVIILGVTGELTDQSVIARLDGLGIRPWEPGEKPHRMQIRAWTVSGRRNSAGRRRDTGRITRVGRSS